MFVKLTVNLTTSNKMAIIKGIKGFSLVSLLVLLPFFVALFQNKDGLGQLDKKKETQLYTRGGKVIVIADRRDITLEELKIQADSAKYMTRCLKNKVNYLKSQGKL